MEQCFLHANCQGEPLAYLLSLSPEFATRWELAYQVNYTGTAVSPSVLAQCSLFLYQYLGPQWGDTSSEALLACLPAHAVAVRLPNLFFKGYWPFWTSQSRMNFGDTHLDALTDKGLSAAEAVHIFLKSDLTQFYDLDTMLAESQALERQREAGSIIELVDFVDAHWRHEPLFTTINHPGPKLTLMVANAVLHAVGLPPLPESVLGTHVISCDPHFHLPIHPGVARHFGLTFANEHTLYPVFGRKMTYREYALCYADCRIREQNLLEYLQS